MPRTAAILLLATLLFVPIAPITALAAEPVDLEMVSRIREEGFRRSQVKETVAHLTDVLGSRVTGSPQMKEANEWTRKKLADWGLANAHLEAYPFGRGWSFSRSAVHMTKPHQVPLFALPKAWTPGTEGAVKGLAMRVDLKSEEDFERYRGKLAGKVLFVDEAKDLSVQAEVEPRRFVPETLEDLAEFAIPTMSQDRKEAIRRWGFRKPVTDFLTQEKALAVVDASARGLGIIRVGRGGSWVPGENTGVPSLTMAAESYNRVVRLLDLGHEVEVEIDVQTRFHDEDTNAYNTIAEIPGTDKNGEVVMVGAHLDSWHGNTGSTDNAAGVVVAMEAVRILKALGVKPRRTIRIALWSGEEEDLLGARAYVTEHFATISEPKDPVQKGLPTFLRTEKGAATVKPDHAKLSAYFNLDNGTGKIRGIYAQGNSAAAPIFEAWLAPLRDLGATTVTMREVDATDHIPFDDAGLPGFQLIQDEIDYTALTHHTNLDSFDHLELEDLKQAAVVMASFVYNAAMRPERLPRKALPK